MDLSQAVAASPSMNKSLATLPVTWICASSPAIGDFAITPEKDDPCYASITHYGREVVRLIFTYASTACAANTMPVTSEKRVTTKATRSSTNGSAALRWPLSNTFAITVIR